MSNILFELYTVSILLYNLTGIEYLFYLTFVYAFYVCISKYNRSHRDYHLVELIIYSIIVPSNYMVLISLVVVLLIKLRKLNKMTGNKECVAVILFVVYLVFNIIINNVKLINLLFYVLYVAPVPLCAIIFSKLRSGTLENKNWIKLLKQIIILQGIGIISELVFHLKTIISMIDFDWVTGTFGEYQGNVFFFFSAFCFIIFLNRYMNLHKDLKYLIVSGVYMIMTGSIALIILFACSIIIYFFITLNIKTATRMRILAFLGVAVCFFILVTPTWIKSYIVTMATADDKSIYISKIGDYENVFFNSENPLEFELFGAGIGEYSSRAALTCTGVYIDSYNSIFEPSMSEYTNKYIYSKLLYVYKYNLGIVSTPYSEYISIKGELGLVGMIFLILYFYSLLRKSKNWSRIFIIFIIMACFTENYMEFAKIVAVLYMVINNFNLNKE